MQELQVKMTYHCKNHSSTNMLQDFCQNIVYIHFVKLSTLWSTEHYLVIRIEDANFGKFWSHWANNVSPVQTLC